LIPGHTNYEYSVWVLKLSMTTQEDELLDFSSSSRPTSNKTEGRSQEANGNPTAARCLSYREALLSP
jgi:hypothetical protein